jgi:replicative DNA helicase
MRKRSEKRREREPAREWQIDVPNDPVNEQVVIAAALVDEEARAKLLKQLPPDAFYAEPHRAIWTSLGEMQRRKLAYDPATIARIGGDSVDVRVLEQLSMARPDVPPNLPFHTETLLWDWQRAKATRGPIATLLEAIQNPKESRHRVAAIARQVADSLAGAVGAGRFIRDPKELIREQMAKVRARAEGQARFPFGIDGLDNFEDGTPRLTIAAAPGKVTMLTGVTGGGKTTIAANLTLGLARQKRRVNYCAWEVDPGLSIETLAVISLEWSRSNLLQGQNIHRQQLTHEELVTLEERMHAISKYVSFMDNPFRRGSSSGGGERESNQRNLDVVQQELEESGAEVAVFDLWARVLVHDGPSDEQQALFRTQAMAEELQMHFLLLHQQRSKDVEMRPDKRPTREGIKGSGALIEVPDTIIAPHIPALWKQCDDNTLEMFVLKQRFGKWPLGIEFGWDGDKGLITGGRSIPYDQPGEGGDEFLDFAPPKKGGKRRR